MLLLPSYLPDLGLRGDVLDNAQNHKVYQQIAAAPPCILIFVLSDSTNILLF